MNILPKSGPDNSNPKKQPFFSVIITTYNRANLLVKALDSLICQTENDWEAIIVDDESTDDTYLRVLPYIQANSNIRYISVIHGGEAMSKNKGISSSVGIHLSRCTIGGTFFIERNTLLKLKGFRKIILGTDSDLFDRAIEAGIAIKETNLPTYIYHRENEDSITNMMINGNSEFEESYTNTNRK